MMADDPNTLTCKPSSKNDAPRDCHLGPVTWNPASTWSGSTSTSMLMSTSKPMSTSTSTYKPMPTSMSTSMFPELHWRHD